MTDCTICRREYGVLIPLHGDAGGPPCCPVCTGKWHAEHGRKRRLGRVVIRAMKAYMDGGGSCTDLDKLRLTAMGTGYAWLDPLGYMKGAASIGNETIELTAELLADAISLVHPDKHPPERQELATRVSHELLALKPFVFPKPAPEPQPARTTPATERGRSTLADLPRIEYPCADCSAHAPMFYCSPCRAEFDASHETHLAIEREKARKRRARKRAFMPAVKCASCAGPFKGKRKDARFCSDRCRQAAHRQAVTDKKGFHSEPRKSRDAEKTEFRYHKV